MAEFDPLNNELDKLEKKSKDLASQSSDDILNALRKARPSWENIPNRGAGGFQPPATIPNLYASKHAYSDHKTDYAAPFPERRNQATVEESVQQVSDTGEYGFQLTISEINNEAYTVDVHVGYGEIGAPMDTEPPDGMTGADDFIFTIPGADTGTEIYAVITYDTDTLAITSRSLAFAFDVPDSTLGTLNVPIGFVDIDYGTGGRLVGATAHNRHCGDMQIQFIFGALNGVTAIYPLRTFGDGQPLV